MRELFTEQSMEIVTSVTKSEWNTIQVALSIRDEIGMGIKWLSLLITLICPGSRSTSAATRLAVLAANRDSRLENNPKSGICPD